MAEVSFIGVDAIVERGLHAAEVAVEQCGEHLVGASQDDAPVVSGTLRAGIHAGDVERAGYTVTITVSTGGESSAYSIIVHEGHRADGSYQRKAGPAKYIERPVIENRPFYIEALRRASASAY